MTTIDEFAARCVAVRNEPDLGGAVRCGAVLGVAVAVAGAPSRS
jgi:hypothetical protein